MTNRIEHTPSLDGSPSGAGVGTGPQRPVRWAYAAVLALLSACGGASAPVESDAGVDAAADAVVDDVAGGTCIRVPTYDAACSMRLDPAPGHAVEAFTCDPGGVCVDAHAPPSMPDYWCCLVSR